MKRDNNEDYDGFRPFPTYVMLGCGITVILVGIYLLILDRPGQGTTLANKYGSGGGKATSISGGGAIFVGILLMIYPTYELLQEE